MQPPSMTEMDYLQVLLLTELRCGTVYGEARLQNLLIEVMRRSIWNKIPSKISLHLELDLSILERYENSISSLRKSKKVVYLEDKGTGPKVTDG